MCTPFFFLLDDSFLGSLLWDDAFASVAGCDPSPVAAAEPVVVERHQHFAVFRKLLESLILFGLVLAIDEDGHPRVRSERGLAEGRLWARTWPRDGDCGAAQTQKGRSAGQESQQDLALRILQVAEPADA